MADVSKIQIGSTTYNIKDSTARTDLSNKAPIASPTFTGTPTAPTAATSTNTTQIATTEFVKKNSILYLSGTIETGTVVTIHDNRINTSTKVISWALASPTVVGSTVNWVTANGSVTLTGTFNGTSAIGLYLADVRV